MRACGLLRLSAAVFSLGGVALLPSLALGDIFDDYGGASESFDFQAEAGLFNRRYFRGQDLYDQASIQPRLRAQANVDIVSFYLEGFSHLETGGTDDKEHPSFSELDYDLGGFAKFDELTVHLGHRWYSYSERTPRLDNTGEFFTKLQLDTVAQPHFEIDYDWDNYRGWYSEAGAEVPLPIELGDTQTSIIPFATVSYSLGLADGPHPIYEDDGFVAIDVGLRGQSFLNENIYLEPEIQYSSGFDGAADDAFILGIRLGAKTSVE